MGIANLRIAPEDREKTTFITQWGAFLYLVMSFCLCNAPATFVRCMILIFANFLHKFLAIFVGDFIVYNEEKHHIQCLRQMFQRCGEKRICLNPFKIMFLCLERPVIGSRNK